MATGSLRGDGLARAQRALLELQDPQQLNRARERFSDSPPPYASHQSHNSTRSQSPDPPGEEQLRREERKLQLRIEHDASRPYHQFAAHVREEERRILYAHRNRIRSIPVGGNFIDMASKIVRERWVQQGIWNDKWSETASGRWKHEEPLRPEPEPERESSSFSFFQEKQIAKPPDSDEEKRRIVERQATRVRQREASRPFHQFIYQVSEERERILEESRGGEATNATTTPPGINTKAYENVKDVWVKRKIWNEKWGILPGLSWKHEEPLEEDAADTHAPIEANENAFGNRDEVGEAPIPNIGGGAHLKDIFGHPVTNHLESGVFARNSPPVEPVLRRGYNITSDSRREPSIVEGSVGLENGYTGRSPSESTTPPKRREGLKTKQTAQPSQRKSSYKGRQTRATSIPSGGPAHSSRVSKAPTKKGSGPRRRLNGSEAVPLGDPLPLPAPDAAEPPRRSARLQLSEPSTVEGLTDTTDSRKIGARSSPKRTAASNRMSAASAKPQGILKRQRTSTTRGKAGKNDD